MATGKAYTSQRERAWSLTRWPFCVWSCCFSDALTALRYQSRRGLGVRRRWYRVRDTRL